MKKLIRLTATTRAMVAGVLLIAIPCLAQPIDSASPRQIKPANELMIKFAPLSILESDGGLNFSVEYLIAKPRIGLQIEAQPVLFNISGDGGNSGFDQPKDVLQSGSLHGIKLKPEVRYYTNGLRRSQRPARHNSRHYELDPETQRRLQKRTYIAIDFLYKQVWQQRVNEFELSSGITQPVRKQQAEYTDVKRITGFEGKVGTVGPVIGEHWLADIYFSIGFRSKKVFYRNLPSGASEPRRGGFFGGSEGTRSENLLSLPIGIKITYRL